MNDAFVAVGPGDSRDDAVATALAWEQSGAVGVSLIEYDTPVRLIVAANGIAKSDWVILCFVPFGIWDSAPVGEALEAVPSHVALVVPPEGFAAFRRGALEKLVQSDTVVGSLRASAEANGKGVEIWKQHFCTFRLQQSSPSSSDTDRPN